MKTKFIPVKEQVLIYNQSQFTGKMKNDKKYQSTKKDIIILLRKLILKDLNNKQKGQIKPSFVKFIKKANYNQLIKLNKIIKMSYFNNYDYAIKIRRS